MNAPARNIVGPSRRHLLTGGLAGGFLLAFHLPVRAANEPVAMAYAPEGPFVPNAFIRIDKAGKTTLVMPQVEMGQGIYTSVPMILAEELDADYAQVALMHAPPNDKLYANPALWHPGHRQFQRPFARSGCRCARRAPSARAMLVQAAAQQWQVEPASCTTSNGQVIHAASGRKLSYGALAEAASSRDAAEGRPAQGPEGLHADRQAAETPRYAGQDQRQGRVRHRRDAARHEVRDPGAVSGVRRQGRPGRRQGGQGRSRRAAGGRARRSGRGRRRSHVGGEEGPRCPRRHLERGPEREAQFEGHLGGSARGERKGRARRERPRATSPRAWRRASGSRRPTSCRFSPTRRWNR